MIPVISSESMVGDDEILGVAILSDNDDVCLLDGRFNLFEVRSRKVLGRAREGGGRTGHKTAARALTCRRSLKLRATPGNLWGKHGQTQRDGKDTSLIKRISMGVTWGHLGLSFSTAPFFSARGSLRPTFSESFHD
jgi:hypothetical protein